MSEDWRTVALEIDDCKYLELRSVEGICGVKLRIIVDEAVSQIGPENPERDFVPELAAQIRSTMLEQPTARSFEIAFGTYISYTVLDETYGRFPEPPEIFSGKLFRAFSWSYLLDITRKTTYASDDHPGPGPLQHYSIACMNDVIDIIACVQPTIRRLA